MKHAPSLCVVCNPCYSKWCYGQILALAPLRQCMGKNRRETLSSTLHTSWERGRVNPILSNNIAKDEGYVIVHVPSICVVCNPCSSHIPTWIWRKYKVDTPPLPRAMQDGARCVFSYSLPYIDCTGTMIKICP